MSAVGTTYSYKDLSGAFAAALMPTPLVFGGQIGAGQIVVTNATEHTSHDTAADGTVMPSAIAGDSGTVTIQCQQTSSIHHYLLTWLNNLKTAFMNGDVSNWAASSMLLRNTVDGSSHEVIGISPQKVPDKSYSAQGANITWTLPACSITNL